MKLVALRKIAIVAVLLALALPLTLVACGEEEAEQGEEVVSTGAALLVQPVSAKIGDTVSILGSGLTPGEIVGIRMCMESGAAPVGITGLLTSVPEVNEFGAFASSLKLTNFAAGVYTLELVEQDKVVATAPLQITEAG